MLSIGVDVVEIDRFEYWPEFSRKTLSKVFNKSEIDYCIANKSKSVERFASHFAVKEAFFKAVCPLLEEELPLLFVFRNINLKNISGIPELIVNWPALNLKLPSFKTPKVLISLSHSRTIAFVTVVLI